MKKGFTFGIAAALSVAMVLPAVDAVAQAKKTTKAPAPVTGAENSLVGIKIYDDALKVLAVFGNPDTISAVSVGSTSTTGGQGGPTGGGPGGPPTSGFGGPPRGGAPSGGGSGAPMKPSADMLIPGSLFDGTAMGAFQKGGMGGAQSLDENAGLSGPGGAPGRGGAPGPGGPSGPGGAGGSSSAESAQFTRWSYTKNGTKLGFVIDKFNRVVQIEAIGLQNKQVQTKRGIGFGSSFAAVMKAYSPAQEPDGYDIAGDNFTIRYLTRTRVAFRFSRLSTKKSHVVTGIVVAAGKK